MFKNRNINLFENVIKLSTIKISKQCFVIMLLNALEFIWFKSSVKWPKTEKVTIFSNFVKQIYGVPKKKYFLEI